MKKRNQINLIAVSTMLVIVLVIGTVLTSCTKINKKQDDKIDYVNSEIMDTATLDVNIDTKEELMNNTENFTEKDSVVHLNSTEEDATEEKSSESIIVKPNINLSEYLPADEDKDGFVNAEEEMAYITPEKQKCIDAGYGVVVEMDNGDWYAVLMKNSTHSINGKEGWEILNEFLQARNLKGSIGGCWINSEKEWYWYIAEDIYEYVVDDGWE